MINIEQQYQQIKISHFDEKGDIAFSNIPVQHKDLFEWAYSKTSKTDSHFKSWDNKPVVKTNTKYLSKFRVNEILINQHQNIKDRIYAYNDPKKFFIDIEVKNDGEWPKPTVARHEITAISFAHKDLLAVVGTKPLSPDQIKTIEGMINEYLATKNYEPIRFSYVYYKSEYDMLYTFFNKWIQKMPLMTGWNFVQFDWQYLINRCRKLAIDPTVASPSNKLVGRDELPLHRVVVDYLEIYKKWDRIIFKENNTLDYVATQATGLEKIKFNGTLSDLYESDFMKYVYYNAIDSLLVKLIHDNIETMETFLNLGKVTKCELSKVFSPIALTETVMTEEFYKRGKVFPVSGKAKPSRGHYEGAYVFTPKKGIYEWVASFDFASLYPTIMRQWNMSPESFIKKEKKKRNEYEDAYTYSSSGGIFDNKEDSVFRVMLSKYYGKRKDAKNKKEDVEHEIDELKKMKNKLEKSPVS